MFCQQSLCVPAECCHHVSVAGVMEHTPSRLLGVASQQYVEFVVVQWLDYKFAPFWMGSRLMAFVY